MQTWEYPATAAALTGGLYLRFLGPQASVNWRGGVLFEDTVVDRMGIDNLDTRLSTITLGNVLFYGSMAYRLIDSLIVPLAVHRDSELALHMSMTDLEAFATVAIVLWGTQAFIARERPLVSRRCADPEFRDALGECELDHVDRNRSFIGGHAATTLAAAGVTCVHHSKLGIYTRTSATIACGVMLGVSGYVAMNRLQTEHHYPSDVALGLGLGALAGWVVPLGIRYDGDGEGKLGGGISHLRTLPWFQPGGGGVVLTGLL